MFNDSSFWGFRLNGIGEIPFNIDGRIPLNVFLVYYNPVITIFTGLTFRVVAVGSSSECTQNHHGMGPTSRMLSLDHYPKHFDAEFELQLA